MFNLDRKQCMHKTECVRVHERVRVTLLKRDKSEVR